MNTFSKLTLVALLATGSCAQAVNVSASFKNACDTVSTATVAGLNSCRNVATNAAAVTAKEARKAAGVVGTFCQNEAAKVVKNAKNLYSDLATTQFIRNNKYTIAAVAAGTVAVYATYRFGKYKRAREINAQFAKL